MKVVAGLPGDVVQPHAGGWLDLGGSTSLTDRPANKNKC